MIFDSSRALSSVFIRSSDQDITVERKTKDPRSFVVSQNYWSSLNFLLCQLLRYFFIIVEQISVRIMLRSNVFKFKRGQRRTDTQRYVCRHRREHTFSSRNGHIKIQKKNCTCKPHIHINICNDARTETHADINAFTHRYTQILSLYISCPWLFSLLLPVTTDMSRKCVFIFSVKFLCRSQFHGNQIKKQKSWVFASLMIKKKTERMEKKHVSWHSNGMCFDVNSLSWHWPRSDVSLLCLLLIRLRHIHLQMIFVNQQKTALSWSVVSSRSSTMFFLLSSETWSDRFLDVLRMTSTVHLMRICYVRIVSKTELESDMKLLVKRLSADHSAFSSCPSKRAAYHNSSSSPKCRPWIYPHIYKLKWSSRHLLTPSDTSRRRVFAVRLYVVEKARRTLQRCPDHLPFRVVLSLSKMSYRFPTKSELAHVTMKISFRVIHDVLLKSDPFLYIKSWMSRDIYNVENYTMSRNISGTFLFSARSTRNMLSSCTYFRLNEYGSNTYFNS